MSYWGFPLANLPIEAGEGCCKVVVSTSLLGDGTTLSDKLLDLSVKS